MMLPTLKIKALIWASGFLTLAFNQCSPAKYLTLVPYSHAKQAPVLSEDRAPLLNSIKEVNPSLLEFIEDSESLELAHAECPDNGGKRCFYLCHISSEQLDVPHTIIVNEEHLMSHLSDHNFGDPSLDYLGACRETLD